MWILFLFAIVSAAPGPSSPSNEPIHAPIEGLLRITRENNNVSVCENELLELKHAIARRDLWALKMLDASGAPGPGFLLGNNFWLGSMSECIDVARQNVSTRFLVATFTHHSLLQETTGLPNEDLVTLGLCVPRNCLAPEVQTMLARMFANGARPLTLQRTHDLDLTLREVRGVEDDSKWLAEPKFIIVMSLLLLAITLCLAGTLYDVYIWRPHLNVASRTQDNNNAETKNNNTSDVKPSDQFQLLMQENGCKSPKKSLSTSDEKNLAYKQGWLGKMLLCFSVPANTKALMDPHLAEDSIHCLHGLRFMGMAWIIMVHTVFYLADYCDNRVQAFRMAEGFAVQVVSNSTLAVDTFFFLSGFLIAYLYYKDEKPSSDAQGGPPTFPGFIRNTKRFFLMVARRFVRLTPVYMIMVGILDINQSKYARTSLFTTTERSDVTCGKYWWRNLLYINNVYSREEMCMSWSWYLSNDMQFFIIGTFLLLLSSSYRNLSASIVGALVAASCAITAYISWSHGYVPTLSQQFNMLNILYDPPWTRIGPYLVGMVTGWYIVRLAGDVKLKRWQVWMCWILGSTCNVSVLFGLAEREISPGLAAAYVGLSRTVWGLGLAWIVVACCTKHAGIAGTILQWPGWVPLSRLTYCAYLLNPLLMQSVYLGSESAMHVDFLPLATYFFGHLGMCYFCAYVLSLLFEAPNILLMRWLITGRSPK